ncbi:MAG: FHA domain-containing protein [Deltaproteobacteria bacterium]|nr:FHA domain-containing protein [Deltaproteobacteria bacterium]
MPSIELEVSLGDVRRIEGGHVVVGRANDATVRLEAKLVSHYHVKLAFRDGRWRAEDLESKNGTFLNRVRIMKADLDAGDVLRLGDGGPKVRVLAVDPPIPA